MSGFPTELFVAFVAVMAVIGARVVYNAWRVRDLAEASPTWSKIAAERGLTRLDGRRYVGQVDGFEVRIALDRSKSAAASLHLELSGGLPSALSLWPRIVSPSALRTTFEEVQVGDPAFDSVFRVRGDEGQVLLSLHAPARAALRAEAQPPWVFDGGVWSLTLWSLAGADLERGLDLGLAIARTLRTDVRRDVDAVERVAGVATRDPLLSMRRRALHWLLANEPTHPATRTALEAACGDRDQGIQILAARELGHLETFARLAATATEPIRLEALELLVRQAPGDARTHRILDEILWKRGPVDGPDRALREAAISLIEELVLTDFEAALITLLDEHDDDLRVRVMRTLGRVGSLAAVPALLPFRELIVGFSLKDTARMAIFEIQARAGGPDHGALSLAQHGGELAIVEPPTG